MRFAKIIGIALSLTATSVSAHSTSKLFDGYYLAKNGDSVLCKINFPDWTLNPKNIHVVVDNKELTLSPADIKGFGVFGYSDYQSATVTYHTNPISLSASLPEEFSENQETNECFLKIMVKGDYSLYELRRPERAYYFLSQHDSAITELVYRVKLKDLELAQDAQYKNTLTAIFLNEGMLTQNQYKISNCGYTSSSIVPLIMILDEKHTGTMQRKPRAKLLQLDLMVGGINTSFPTSFDGRYALHNKFNSSLSPSVGLNFLYIFPSRFKSFAAGISAEFYQYSASVNKSGSIKDSMSANFYYTTTYSEKLSTKNSVLMTNFYAMYFINHFGSTRFYVKGGASVNMSITSNIDVNSNYTASKTGISNGVNPISESGQGTATVIPIEKMFVTFNPSVGFINGRSKLELNYYYVPTQMNSTNSTPFKLAMLGAHYCYTIMR